MPSDDSLDDLAGVITNLARRRAEAVEYELVRLIEEIEGHMPNDQQIVEHGHRFTDTTGAEWYEWRGEIILYIEPAQVLEDRLRIKMHCKRTDS